MKMMRLPEWVASNRVTRELLYFWDFFLKVEDMRVPKGLLVTPRNFKTQHRLKNRLLENGQPGKCKNRGPSIVRILLI